MAPIAAVPYAVGVLVVHGGVSIALGAWGLGVLVHSYSCFVNDLVDVDDDAQNPARASSPLVNGSIDRPAALHAALLHVVAFSILLWALHPPAPSAAGLVGVWGLLSYGNVFQKRSTRISPVIMDQLCGVALGAPVVVMAAFTGRPLPVSAWLLALSYGLQLALANAAAGNIKDLDADRKAGRQTTAIRAGVEVNASLVVRASGRYQLYCYALQVGSVTAAFAAALLSGADLLPTTCAALLVAVLGLRATYDVRQLVGGFRPCGPRGREPFIVVNLIVFVAAAVPVIGPMWGSGLVIGSFAWTAISTLVLLRWSGKPE